MPAESHFPRTCAKCGGQLPSAADACPWCHAPVAPHGSHRGTRVRKKRGLLSTYFEHVRRHWLVFLLAVLAAIIAAWFLLGFGQRPSGSSASAPTSLALTFRVASSTARM